MISFILFLVLLPAAGFLINLVIPGKNEKLISGITCTTVCVHMLAATLFIVYWLMHGHPVLNQKDIVLFRSPDYELFIDFYFDKITAVYLFTGSFLTFIAAHYSRQYLHREKGYKRFFIMILFFCLGYNTVILSGNLETLFAGWEMLGISSFLLIAFYREKYLPLKNMLGIFFFYRISDAGLILAIWASHHVWHENLTFLNSGNHAVLHEHIQSHNLTGIFISLLLLITASAKSAQLPFSSWLPRAMEGPAPSSAIFYGALSVHLGVFLLLRTFLFWEQQLSVRILITFTGLTTAIIATGIARVQSSVKSRIAFASIAQTGLIFIEVAAGLKNIALFHFAGNAFLRTFQLLVYPTITNYLMRGQFYDFSPRTSSIENNLPKKLRNTFYIICIKEWNLNSRIYRFLLNPSKMPGNRPSFLTFNRAIVIFIPAYLVGMFCLYQKAVIPGEVKAFLPLLFLSIGLDQFHGHAYKHPKMAWLFLLCCLSFSGISVTPAFISENFIFSHIQENQLMPAFIIVMSLVINALAIIRIYARVFSGPHAISINEMAYRSL